MRRDHAAPNNALELNATGTFGPARARFKRFIQTALILLGACAIGRAQSRPSSSDVEHRINELLGKMTVEEKVGQLLQFNSATPENLALVKQGKVGSLFNVLGANEVNAAQHIAIEQTRLKIPLLFGYDTIHGYRTIFPVPIGTASSFDPALIEEIDRIAAKEATAAGVKWTFAPMVDITRDPRWGRMVEGAGEDPYLGSAIAAAAVRGFQGSDIARKQSLIACAKHLAGYGAVEGGREYNGAELSEQLLREVYLPPFRAAIKAGAGTIMTSLSALNGIPTTANHHLLTDIVRREWHFDGLVDSDYDAVHQLIDHGIAGDDQQASYKALTAGLDMDMADGAFQALLSTPRNQLPMQRLDEAVGQVLRLKFRAGLFQNPYVDPEAERSVMLTPDNLQAARKAAQESLILLKNGHNILPLGKDIKTIAVIGPLANDKGDQLGPWAGRGRAEDAIAPLEGIKAKLPNAQVLYVKGVDIPSFEKLQPAADGAPAPLSATGVAVFTEKAGADGIERAVQAAQRSDVAVLFLGELAEMTGEASARATLDFPGQQQELLEKVVATGKPVVLIVESGRPLDVRWANDHVNAMIQAWYPGVQAGNAIADVLFGDADPSARLPMSWPRSVGQIPIYYNHESTGRPTSPDRWHTGYLEETSAPLFPFGYGLTYTTFRYSNLRIKTSQVRSTGDLQVEADIENTGTRAGTEVVQLYIHDRVAPTARPVRELKGFQRVTLKPQEKKTVEFSVKAGDLGSYDTALKWVLPAGTYDVWVAPDAGASGVQGTFEVATK